MSLQRFAPAAIAVACFAVCVSANADTDSAFRFSGFGTVGASHTDNGDVEFVVPGQEAGHGARSDGFSFTPDTKLGVQANYDLNSTFSGTLQLLSKYNGKGTYDPSVEWAFVKAKFLNDWNVRVGRIGTPIFMISDYREVNYANIWTRPPNEVYSQVVFSHADGADINYQHSFGSTTISGSVFAGKAKAIYNTAEVEGKNNIGMNFSAETDSGFTFRYGYSQCDLSVASSKFNSLAAGLNKYVALLPTNGLTSAYKTDASALAGTLTSQGARASFSGFGASWDHGNWIVSGEYTKRKAGDAISDTTGWYTSVGYRVGKFTPYAYAAQLKVDKIKLVDPYPKLGSPYSAVPVYKGLSANTGFVAGLQDIGQKTFAIGSRWDAWRNVALKAQVEVIKPDGLASGSLYSTAPVTNPTTGAVITPATNAVGKTINVLSLSVDFVF